MEVHQRLASAFHAEGVRAVFNIMGDGNKLWLVSMAAQPGVQLYNVRHEGAALAMADGYARSSNEVGVCSVTYATGVTQIATSLAVAAKHGTPLVVLAADTPAEQRGMSGHLDINVRSLVEATGALAHEVRTSSSAAEDVHLAFYRARTEKRPVVLLARSDLMDSPSPTSARDARPLSVPPSRPMPDPDQVATAAELIRASERPIVLAGRGVSDPSARQAVADFANACGALLATTLQAKGLFDSEPFNLGIAGMFSHAPARRFFANADCVIAVGAGLNPYTTADGTLFPQARVVQIDIRPDALVEGVRSADAYLQGNAQDVADALAAELTGKGTTRRWRTEETRAELSSDPRRAAISENPANLPKATMDPRELVMSLDDSLPDNAIIVTGVGHYTSFPVMYLRNPRSRDFLTVLDFITIGQAVPSAIGAATACPERPVVAFEGDASFMMHVQEIETAARYGLPILVFVMNDGALGAEYHKLRSLGLDTSETIMPAADICEVGAALGARTRRATRTEDLKEVAEWFNADFGPHIVDCPVARTVTGPL